MSSSNYLFGKQHDTTSKGRRFESETTQSSRYASKKSSSGTSVIQVQSYMEGPKSDIGGALRKASDILARYALDLSESGETDVSKMMKNFSTVLDGFTNDEMNVILMSALAKMIANG
jgi:hypothetical protein